VPACQARRALPRPKAQPRLRRQALLRQPVHLESETRPMSKKKRERALSDNEAKAVARMLRVSPQKLNLLAQLIRGKKVSAALADLEFSRKRIARDVRKCLESAIANAENNHDLDVDDLVVAEAHVGKALVIKRHAARARGRVGAIFKPFANLTIVVREVEAQA
jgi:large subunit ribosomal protein L22